MNAARRESGELRVSHAESIGHRGEGWRKTLLSMPSAIGLISNTMPNLIDWLRVSCSPKNDALYFWRTTSSDDTNARRFRADSAVALSCSMTSAMSTDSAALSFPKLSQNRATESSRDARAEGHNAIMSSS
jgi:hypothetical protein